MSSNVPIPVGDKFLRASEKGEQEGVVPVPGRIAQFQRTVERSTMWTWPILLSQSWYHFCLTIRIISDNHHIKIISFTKPPFSRAENDGA